MNDIERLKNHLERAFAEVSKLKVSGDVVDTVHEIREALRAAFRVAVKMDASLNQVSETAKAGRPLSQATPDSSPCEGEPLGEEDRDGEVNADAAAADEV